jgi:hypothetical protein
VGCGLWGAGCGVRGAECALNNFQEPASPNQHLILKVLQNNKIPILKHQITNKSQYSMIQKTSLAGSYRFAKPGLPVMS